MPAMGNPRLHDVLADVEPGTVVVFDLDATLLWSGQRHLKIAQDFGAFRAGAARAVANLSAEDFGYEADAALRAAGLKDKRLLREFKAFWGQKYFTSKYCLLDLPQPGAVDFVHAVEERGARVVYLTGRDEPKMGEGTRRSLAQHAFPLGRRTTLLLKPRPRMGDTEWKQEALPQVEALGRVVATFENEPRNANLFARRFPEATNVLMETVCSPGAEAALPQLVRTADFVI